MESSCTRFSRQLPAPCFMMSSQHQVGREGRKGGRGSQDTALDTSARAACLGPARHRRTVGNRAGKAATHATPARHPCPAQDPPSLASSEPCLRSLDLDSRAGTPNSIARPRPHPNSIARLQRFPPCQRRSSAGGVQGRPGLGAAPAAGPSSRHAAPRQDHHLR